MDESKLIEKLRRIEALHAGATTEGERLAAAAARAAQAIAPRGRPARPVDQGAAAGSTTTMLRSPQREIELRSTASLATSKHKIGFPSA